MDPTACLRDPCAYIPAEKAEQPQYYQNDDDSPQHEISPLIFIDQIECLFFQRTCSGVYEYGIGPPFWDATYQLVKGGAIKPRLLERFLPFEGFFAAIPSY